MQYHNWHSAFAATGAARGIVTAQMPLGNYQVWLLLDQELLLSFSHPLISPHHLQLAKPDRKPASKEALRM